MSFHDGLLTERDLEGAWHLWHLKNGITWDALDASAGFAERHSASCLFRALANYALIEREYLAVRKDFFPPPRFPDAPHEAKKATPCP